MLNDKEYFCDRIHEYERGMYTLALGILKNEEDAADVVQDSILKAYSNLDTLRNRKLFRPWIMQIVHNTAIAFLRKRRDITDIDIESEPAVPEPNVDTETKLTVWEAVQSLRLPYRLVIILFYYEDCSIRQIASITSSPAAAVRQQLSRGRKMLAEILDKEDFQR